MKSKTDTIKTSIAEEIKKGKEMTLSYLLIIIIGHLFLSFQAFSILQKIGFSFSVSIIIASFFELLVFPLLYVAFAKNKTCGIGIINALSVIAYLALLLSTKANNELEKASQDKISETDRLQINSYLSAFQKDSAKIASDANKEFSKLNTQIDSKRKSLQADIAAIEKDIVWRRSNGYDIGEKQNEIAILRGQMNSIVLSPEQLQRQSEIEAKKNNALLLAQSSYNNNIEAITRKLNDEKKDRMTEAKTQNYVFDVFIVTVIILLHYFHFAVVDYLKKCKLSLREFLVYHVLGIEKQTKKESFEYRELTEEEKIEVDLLLSQFDTNFQNLRMWYLRGKDKKQKELSVIRFALSQKGYDLQTDETENGNEKPVILKVSYKEVA